MADDNMEIQEITMIPADAIWQHPDNPRKDLGDLTESIRKKGIMQNLTVIPGHYMTDEEWKELAAEYKKNPTEELRNKMNTIHMGKFLTDGYTLIIGHRRFAAGKQAGVTEFPCRIVKDMDKREQIGTMLEENMQRNDLTILEQANGFQLMLDLGVTEEQISEKTGFSRTTVRHRLNIAKLNQTELKKKTDADGEFQLTLTDLYELEKIKDIKARNKVLKEATSSRDLVWRAKRAVEVETRARNLRGYKELFKKAGIKQAPKGTENERYSGKWESLQEWDLEKEPPKTLKKFKEDNLQYVVYFGTTVAVIVPAKKKEKKLSEYEIREKERQKARKSLKQKSNEMYADAIKFIKGVISGDIEPLKEDVGLYKELLTALIDGNVSFIESNLANVFTGYGLYELQHDHPEKWQEFKQWKESLSPLQRALAYMSDVKYTELYGYNGEYREEPAKKVKAVFGFLAKYGFSVTEEEEKLLDGTSELYVKEDKACS
jgi:ParB family chromosome partitioning protein